MRKLSPQTSFLLRGSLLLVAMLVVWWWVLLAPSLAVLWGTAQLPFGFFSARAERLPDGQWDFHIPVSARRPDGGPIGSIEFNSPEADVRIFTMSLPVFWAILLAAPAASSRWRAMLKGTLSLIVVNAFSLLAFAAISAHRILQQVQKVPDPTVSWMLSTGQYLVVNLLPYGAPLIAAALFYPGLRMQFFEPAPAAVPRKPQRAKQRKM